MPLGYFTASIQYHVHLISLNDQILLGSTSPCLPRSAPSSRKGSLMPAEVFVFLVLLAHAHDEVFKILTACALIVVVIVLKRGDCFRDTLSDE